MLANSTKSRNVFLRFCVHLQILRDVSRKGYISAGFHFCLKARQPNSREEDAQPWNTFFRLPPTPNAQPQLPELLDDELDDYENGRLMPCNEQGTG